MPSARDGALLLLGIIGLMILEGLVLGLLWRRHRRGIPPAALYVNLLAGISLLLAAVVLGLGLPAPWLAACLALALLMHVADLRLRWHPQAHARPPRG
jgi:peptidoglycan/LPS O-acetylase OafA/YrhL